MLKALVCASWRRIVILGLLILLLLATASQTASHNKMSSIPSPSQVYLPLLAKSGEAVTISTITPSPQPSSITLPTLSPTHAILPTATVTMTRTGTEMPTATASATPTLEPTATTMPTITPTATVTSTEVCAYGTGVYPIALPEGLFNANGFKNPDALYNDVTYQNKTVKRVYMADTGASDKFTFLAWKGLWGQPDLEQAMTDSGNLSNGFEEAVWADTQIPPPADYPLLPQQLNAGDWIRGFSGTPSISTALKAALQDHVTGHTMLILPIIDKYSNAGVNSSHHAARFGTFLLQGYSEVGGAGFYLELVYIAEASCAQTP